MMLSVPRPISFTTCVDGQRRNAGKAAHAIHRMYEVAGLTLKTATEAEKASLRLWLSAQGWREISGLTEA
jgi:hypothetical protein